MNLPHALATLTRDVLQNWRPVWRGHCDLGPYWLEGEPLYGVDKGPLVTLRFIHEQERWRKAFERYMRKMEDIALYGGKVMSLEEVTLMYPDTGPVRCVGEDGSIVYARVHFEHPPVMVKGRLKD